MTRRQYFVFDGVELIGHVSANDREAAMVSARSLYRHAANLRVEPVTVTQQEPKALELPEPEEVRAPRPRKRRTG